MTFQYQDTLLPATLARTRGAGQLGALFEAIQTAFGFYAEESGAADAYVLTLAEPMTSLVDGQVVVWRPTYTNTSTTCTANVDGTGAVGVTLQDGTAPSIGDIRAGYFTIMRYNETNAKWEIISVTHSMIAMVDAVAALSAGGGLLCSATDTTIGPHWTKIVPGVQGNITAYTSDDTLTADDFINVLRTLNGGGGNETITLGVNEPIVTNAGAVGAVNLNLPAGAAGYSLTVIVIAAQYFKQTANGTETFRCGSDQSAAGGYVRSNEVGCCYRLVWNGTEWAVIPMSNLMILMDE